MTSSVEDTDESMEEEIPKILSPGVSDVFPLFVNMLDIKSFMRLSMTSKTMHNRCMEDERIQLDVKEGEMIIRASQPEPEFNFLSVNVTQKHMESYRRCLEQLHLKRKCRVNLKKVAFVARRIDHEVIGNGSSDLYGMCVRSIDRFETEGKLGDWKEILPVLQGFNVKHAALDYYVPEKFLRSILEMNLSSFTAFGSIRPEIVLEVDSPIPEIHLYGDVNIPEDIFMKFLWMIQTGTLKLLCLSVTAVPWLFHSVMLPFAHNEPLPQNRPLIFTKSDGTLQHLWFLHWHDEMTKCVVDRLASKVTIFKCERIDFPPIFKTEEEVLKEFKEKRDKVNCSLIHFNSFFADYKTLEDGHEGPFPEDRPLLCKFLDHSIWLMGVDDSLEEYKWENGTVTRREYDLREFWPTECKCAPLAKFIVKRMIKTRVADHLHFQCENLEQFRSWLDGFRTLPHDYVGPLPEERPLVFEKFYCTPHLVKEQRVLLHEDGTLIQYQARGDPNEPVNCMVIDQCLPWNRPSIFISKDDLQDILMNDPYIEGEFIYRIDSELFLTGFPSCRRFPFDFDGYLPHSRPLLFEKTEICNGQKSELRWFLIENLTELRVLKCQWQGGFASYFKANSETFPPILAKKFITEYFKGKRMVVEGRRFIFKPFPGYLEDIETVPYDYSGPIPRNRTLIFKDHVQSQDFSGIRLWLFFSHEEQILVEWNESTGVLEFRPAHDQETVAFLPPLLKSKDYLKFLLENIGWVDDEFEWHGNVGEFLKLLDESTILNSEYIGRLPPADRPLLFIRDGGGLFWYLRDDSCVICFEWKQNRIVLQQTTVNLPLIIQIALNS